MESEPTGHHVAEIVRSQSEGLNTGISIDRENGTARLLEHAIRRSGGKIPYSQFMELSLFGPKGYYSTGKAKIEKTGGDFSTNPEISEYFGAPLGNAIRKVWKSMSEEDQKNFTIVEMGAGNGTLAKNILTWAKDTDPEFYNTLSYTIVEYGDLINKQKETLKDFQENEKIQWLRRSASEGPLPEIVGVFLSNELPDAFPVEIVKKIDGQLRQKYVALENDQWVEKWENLSDAVQTYITTYEIDIPEDVEEAINLPAVEWQKKVDQALIRGAVITDDYGQNGIRGSKRATRTFPEATSENPFPEYKNPGDVDITSDINFDIHEAIAEEDGLQVAFSKGQTDFLICNGVHELVAPTMDAVRRTKSLKIMTELFDSVKDIKYILENEDYFYVQVLTKGVDVNFWEGNHPPVSAIFETGFRLKVGEPHKSFIIASESQEGNILKSDADGYIYLDREMSPDIFLNPDSQYQIRDVSSEPPKIVLNTGDRKALKEIAGRSGYTYDLAA